MTEIPDADRAEQAAPYDDPDDAVEEVEFPSNPLDDAPEADVVEQSIPVPFEEDYR